MCRTKLFVPLRRQRASSNFLWTESLVTQTIPFFSEYPFIYDSILFTVEHLKGTSKHISESPFLLLLLFLSICQLVNEVGQLLLPSSHNLSERIMD